MRLLVHCFGILLFSFAASAAIENPQKIGIGTWEIDNSGTDLNRIENMKFNWYYTWRTTPLSSPNATAPRNVPFVPMFWDESHVHEALPNSTVLLTFNEPDNAGQANMSVSEALALWPNLMNKGRLLASPATATRVLDPASWFAQFMNQALANGYRVDVIALHYYTGNKDVAAFKAYLEAVYAKYQRPIWITEFGLVDWNTPGSFTHAENAAFAAAALEMLDDLPFVHKHAWFAANRNHENLNTELYDASGNLTAVGQVFQQALTLGTVPPPVPVPVPSASIQNPGFESGWLGWANWGNASVVSSGMASGAYAMRVGSGAGGLGQDVINRVQAGRTYRMSAMSRLGTAGEQAWFNLEIKNSSGTMLTQKSVPVTATTYTRISADFTVPAGADSAMIYLWKGAGSSYVYLDDVSLVDTVTSPDITRPVAALTSPANGARLARRTRVTLKGSATDNVGVTKVEFFVNGTRVCTDTSAAYTCSWTTPRSATSVNLRVKAYDAAGNIGVSTTVTVQVQ